MEAIEFLEFSPESLPRFFFLQFLPAGHYTYDRYLSAATDRANFPASNKLVDILY